MPTKIFLWSAPRSISTPFERSMREVKHSKVFHEMYVKATYFGPDRQNRRFKHQAIDESLSNKEVTRILGQDFDDFELVFVKDMAYAVENHFEILLSNELKGYKHTFLIRDPRKTIPKFYNVSCFAGIAGWDYFDPLEVGFKQMYDLYKFLQTNNLNPVAVDADDLELDPERTMKAYCKATGLPFDQSMLTWEPGSVPDWEGEDPWHGSLLNSCGFIKQDEETVRKFPDASKFPIEVQQTIVENIQYFEFLKKEKLNPFTDK